MAKKNKYQDISPQTQDEALKAAKATQRPGQTKEQTKLIAQGIEKGINHYKKHQKEKARELNKKINKASRQLVMPDNKEASQIQVEVIYKHAKVPWILLLISWLGFCVYLLLGW
jgi:hypothetical protein